MKNDLFTKIWKKMDAETFTTDDFRDYFKLFVEICNSNENIYEEIEDWENVIQWCVEGYGDFYISIKRGILTFHHGNHVDPDIIFELDSEQAIDLFLGIEDAKNLYTKGKIKITGELKDAMRFRLLTEIVREELEEYQPHLFE